MNNLAWRLAKLAVPPFKHARYSVQGIADDRVLMSAPKRSGGSWYWFGMLAAVSLPACFCLGLVAGIELPRQASAIAVTAAPCAAQKANSDQAAPPMPIVMRGSERP